MNIKPSRYYDDLTRSLHDDRLEGKINFTESGFSYMSESLALVMQKKSKNNYVICSIYNSEYHLDMHSCMSKAIDFAKRAIALDIEGYFMSA